MRYLLYIFSLCLACHLCAQVTPQKTVKDDAEVLYEDTVLLNEVTVTAKYTGVIYKGDTIKYNTRVFKDGSEKVLGDLLNKLPGIEVDETGKVKSQGKAVDKVLFNGQDHFNGNAQVALKNLSAEVAESVEVINNYSEYSLLEGFQTHEGTALNIGVNKGFLGRLNGEVTAGYGVENKHNYRANVMKMDSKSMFALIGAYNNTGADVFTIEDYIQLQGGAKALVNTNRSNVVELSEIEKELLSPQNNVHARNNGLGSLNFASQWSSRLKMNGYLLYNSKQEKKREESTNTYIIPDRENLMFFNQTRATQHTHFISSNVNFKYDASETLKMEYRGVFSGNGLWTESDNRDEGLNIDKTTPDSRKMQSFQMNHSFSFIKGTSNGLTSGDLQGRYSKLDTRYSIPELTEKQYQTDFLFAAGLSYTHKWEEWLLKGGISSSYRKDAWEMSIHQAGIELWDHSLYVSFSKKTGLFRFNMGGSAHLYNASVQPGQRIDNTVSGWTPDMDITLYFSPKNILKAYYREENRTIAATYLGNHPFMHNYKTVTTGHNLKTIWNQHQMAGVSYQFYDLFSRTMFFLVGGYRKYVNDMTYNYNSDGILTKRIVVNSPDSYTASGNVYFEKGLGGPFTFKLNGSYVHTGLTNFVENQENKIKINRASGKVSLTGKLHRFFQADVFTEVSYADNYSSLVTKSGNQSTWQYGGEIRFTMNNKWVATIQCGHLNTKTGEFRKDIVLLNGKIHYAISERLEMSISGQNMLHVSNMSWNSLLFDGYRKKEQLFSQIPGHVLLNLGYKF